MALHHWPNSLVWTTTCQLIFMLPPYDPGVLLSTHMGSVLGSNLKVNETAACDEINSNMSCWEPAQLIASQLGNIELYASPAHDLPDIGV